MNTRRALLDAACERILGWAEDDLRTLRGSRLFVSGGAGFLGRWLLASFLHANRRLGLGASAVSLSRQPHRLSAEAPWLLGDPSLTWITGDLRGFVPPPGDLSHIIHAAAPTLSTNRDQPLETISTVIDGTRCLLDIATERHTGAFLKLSTGAIYGPQPDHLATIPEDHRGGPDPLDPAMVLPEAKRLAENLAMHYACRPGGPRVVVGRVFTCLGPDLPRECNYAIDHFLRAAAAGVPLVIQGDGRAVRSYLHIEDMTAWLWALLVRGRSGCAYNVGGGEAAPIADWARRVAGQRCPVEIRGAAASSMAPGQRYLPDTTRIRSELGVRAWTTFDDAIAFCINWIRAPG